MQALHGLSIDVTTGSLLVLGQTTGLFGGVPGRDAPGAGKSDLLAILLNNVSGAVLNKSQGGSHLYDLFAGGEASRCGEGKNILISCAVGYTPFYHGAKSARGLEK